MSLADHAVPCLYPHICAQCQALPEDRFIEAEPRTFAGLTGWLADARRKLDVMAAAAAPRDWPSAGQCSRCGDRLSWDGYCLDNCDRDDS